jgi:GxxExxY protein
MKRSDDQPRAMSGVQDDPLTGKIIGVAIDVHRGLGPGLLESVYEEVLALELERAGLSVRRQVHVPIVWKGEQLTHGLRLDMLVGDEVIVEVKCVERIQPVHEAQLISYMRLASKRTGLLMNFHVVVLRDGITRCVI